MVLNFFNSQVEQLMKLDYKFYYGIARAGEPLTFSTIGEDGELQVEVNAYEKDGKLIVAFDSDTNGGGRWKKNKDYQEYVLTSKNEWRTQDR